MTSTCYLSLRARNCFQMPPLLSHHCNVFQRRVSPQYAFTKSRDQQPGAKSLVSSSGLALCDVNSAGIKMCLRSKERNYHRDFRRRMGGCVNDSLCNLRPPSALSRAELLQVQKRCEATHCELCACVRQLVLLTGILGSGGISLD